MPSQQPAAAQPHAKKEKTPEQIARIAEHRRRWRERNAEKEQESRRAWRARNVEKHRAQVAQWQSEHREQRRAAAQRRRAAERRAAGTVSRLWRHHIATLDVDARLIELELPARRTRTVTSRQRNANAEAAREFFELERTEADAQALRRSAWDTEHLANVQAFVRESAIIRRHAFARDRFVPKTAEQMELELEEARLDAIGAQINRLYRIAN